MGYVCYWTVNGEAASVDTATINTWKETLASIISVYKLKDIFNAEEAGLFFKMQPSKTLSLKGKACHGG
ncbi:hypothetical protein HPB50_000367 [Hyalomma asiaticum]|uniref:Uncharacterized protein n=1 Tax=Hyalomma asiaticum TaxID=266040 RepID=A0ACB7SJ41_HYAAI|nr:hypothetical protein HPB50_000367 [Hyalomma asiaticum]